MTTFHYASDLHLEFEDTRQLKVPSAGDVLLLAGDTVVTRHLVKGRNDAEARKFRRRFDHFLDQCSGFDRVFLVPGNHEPYGHEFHASRDTLAEYLDRRGGPARLLQNEAVELAPDLVLLSTTLWTDMMRNDAKTKRLIARYMNDFRVITYDDHIFTPDDCIAEHERALSFLDAAYRQYANKPGMQFVVMTHHGPTHQSAHRYYDDDMAGGYHSDCSQFIHDRQQIKFWVHGHTHYNVDYMVGGCRVLTNQRGYGPMVTRGGDPCYAEFKMDKTFEVNALVAA